MQNVTTPDRGGIARARRRRSGRSAGMDGRHDVQMGCRSTKIQCSLNTSWLKCGVRSAIFGQVSDSTKKLGRIGVRRTQKPLNSWAFLLLVLFCLPEITRLIFAVCCDSFRKWRHASVFAKVAVNDGMTPVPTFVWAKLCDNKTVDTTAERA